VGSVPTLDIVWDLLLAAFLGSLIGLEREFRQKSAGLRTHALVAVGSALFMSISKYGFSDLHDGQVSLDPSRIAAQVVSGIGFIGGGLIFVRRDAVKGLTTSAIVWVTAAVGMAAGAGAGLQLIAVFVTALDLAIMLGLTPISERLDRRRPTRLVYQLVVRYADGRGALRQIIRRVNDLGFSVDRMLLARTMSGDDDPNDRDHAPRPGRTLDPDYSSTVELSFQVTGSQAMEELVFVVTSIAGVRGVTISPEAASD
jgi:putative Mg2+ transporter-C (MgtC) family protein